MKNIYVVSYFTDDDTPEDNSIPFGSSFESFTSALQFVKGFVIGRLVGYDSLLTLEEITLDVGVYENEDVKYVKKVAILWNDWMFEFTISELSVG